MSRDMNIILAIIAIIFGILVIIFKDLLSWIVGIAFILLGLYLLFDYFSKSGKKTTPQASQQQPSQQQAPPPTTEEKK